MPTAKARIFLTNRAFETEDGPVAARTLGLVIGRHVDGGLHEDIEITNNSQKPVRFNLEVATRADFADIFEVSHFLLNQLPELYAGLQRDPTGFPVQYLGANVPQAWAAGTPFVLLQAMLGLQQDAPSGQLYVDPE